MRLSSKLGGELRRDRGAWPWDSCWMIGLVPERMPADDCGISSVGVERVTFGFVTFRRSDLPRPSEMRGAPAN